MRRTKADPSKQSYVVKLEMYPTVKQARYLDGQSRMLNWERNALVERVNRLMGELKDTDKPCLDERAKEILNQVYGATGVRDLVPMLKEQNPFLYKVHSSPLKNVAFGVTQAIKAHQKKQRTGSGVAGWPRFSKWSESWTSIFYEEKKGWKVVQAKASKCPRARDGRKYLSLSFGKLQDGTKLGASIELETTSANFKNAKNVRIVKEGKRFYAVFLFEKTKARAQKLNKKIKKPKSVKAIFLDPNHKNFAYGVDTQGAAYEFGTMMKDIQAALKRIDALQKRRDKCVKKCKKIEYTRSDDGSTHHHWESSRRWKMYNRLLLDAWRKLREQKNQFQGSLAHLLCRRYQVIGIGDYVPASTDHGRGRKYNRAMVNNTFHAQFKARLKWIAEKSGRTYLEVDEKGTTRTCRACGFIVEGGLDPSIRAWRCSGCGKHHIRDENAAINGLSKLLGLLGFSQLPSLGQLDVVSRSDFRYQPAGWSEIKEKASLERK